MVVDWKKSLRWSLPLRPCAEYCRDSGFSFVLHITDLLRERTKLLYLCWYILSSVTDTMWLAVWQVTVVPTRSMYLMVAQFLEDLDHEFPNMKNAMDKDAMHVMNDSGGRESWLISTWWGHWGANWQQVQVWWSWSGRLSNSGQYTTRDSEHGRFCAYALFFFFSPVYIFNVILKKE